MYPALLVALSDPANPQDPGALTRWYEQTQIPFFLSLPGTRRITRYRSSAVQPAFPPPTPQQYLALYELEWAGADGLTAYATAQAEALQQKRIGRSSPGADGLDPDTVRGAYYEQIGAAGPAGFVPQAVVLAYADPEPGEADDAYRSWLAGHHLQDALRAPGVKCAAVHRLTHPRTGKPPPPWVVPERYLAVYGVQARGKPSLSEVLRGLLALPESARGFAPASRMQLYERMSDPSVPR